MKTSEEFVKGKHEIGYVSSHFIGRVKAASFDQVAVPPRAITLSKYMSDSAIESELKPGISTLGDVLAVMDSGEEKYKDGNWNLFYLESCVVSVYWNAYDREWYVSAWYRGYYGWGVGVRVFSPASDRSSSTAAPSDLSLVSFDSRLKKLEALINPNLLK